MQFIAVVDGCPSDSLTGQEDTWHTFAILQAGSFRALEHFIVELRSCLKASNLQLRKWGGNASNEKQKMRNANFREGFIVSLRTALPKSQVNVLTVSCQEKVIVAAEDAMCKVLGLEHAVVMGDRQSICLGGYTRHWCEGREVVTLGPFEKVLADGHAQVISEPLLAPRKNAVIWLWMAYILWSLYMAVAEQCGGKPAWQVHFDRLANDDVARNYPGLGFIDMLLKSTTNVELTSSYAEVSLTPTDMSTPDLIVDCIAGWANESITNWGNTRELEAILGEERRSHLELHVLNGETDIRALPVKFTGLASG